MGRQHFLLVFVFIFLVIFCHYGHTQVSENSLEDPLTLDDYSFVARGRMSRTRGKNPQEIARLDNNGEILIACMQAKTFDALRSMGIKILQSQLELLGDWQLLEFDRNNSTYRTTIHIFGTEKASIIRQMVNIAAEQLAEEMYVDLLSLLNYLKKIGREKSMFSILYGYILHHYSMEQFAEEIYIKPQLTTDRPFWNGFSWAIYPVKKFSASVTQIPVEGTLFFLGGAPNLLGPGFQDFYSLAKDVAVDNKVDDIKLLETLLKFGIFDEQGELTVPVFEGEWPNKLQDMAKRVYSKTVELAESPEMIEILQMETQAQSAMFIHYELRYALLKYLLETGLIKTPIDFEDADNNSPADIGNMFFLIKPAKSEKGDAP